MANFHIIGRIEWSDGEHFAAILNAVPVGASRGVEPPGRTSLESSYEHAAVVLRKMAIKMGEELRADGHQVVDVRLEQ